MRPPPGRGVRGVLPPALLPIKHSLFSHFCLSQELNVPFIGGAGSGDQTGHLITVTKFRVNNEVFSELCCIFLKQTGNKKNYINNFAGILLGLHLHEGLSTGIQSKIRFLTLIVHPVETYFPRHYALCGRALKFLMCSVLRKHMLVAKGSLTSRCRHVAVGDAIHVRMHDEIFHLEIFKNFMEILRYFKTPSLKYFMKFLIFIKSDFRLLKT